MISKEAALSMVGPGWASLVAEIYARLPAHVRVTQVKEKYGGLRFYIDGGDDTLLDFIDTVEQRSYTVCEQCGSPGTLRMTGWYKTLCDDCVEKGA